MTTYLFANNASSTLAGPISSVATSMAVSSGTGVLFPNPSAGQAFKLTLVSASNPNTREIVLVTSVSGDTFTITRGQESTAAAAWNAGDFANHYLTAGSFANFLQGNYGAQSFIYYGMDSTNTNAYAATVTPTITALSNGMTFDLDVTNASTSTTCTFNPSGLGAIPIHRCDGSALVIGDIGAAPFHARLVYDLGLNTMLLQNPAGGIHGQMINIQTFTASGTYTPTAGTNKVIIEAIGGGGGGGGCYAPDSTHCAAGGGGSGACYARGLFTSGFSGLAVTIGAGGAGGAGAANGGSGGTTSVGSIVSCPGGVGGAQGVAAATSASYGPSGLGSLSSGTIVGGNLISRLGQEAWDGTTYGGSGYGGQGGDSALGHGGGNCGNQQPGHNGNGYGSGGGGSCSVASGATSTGGAGAPGLVIVYEYA